MSSTDAFSTGYRPEPVRRNLQFGPSSEARDLSPESKKLTVGRDIQLQGEISACERLVVEGRVEAKLSRCKLVEIAKGGSFKGEAEVDDADISGIFEGKLKVRGVLTIRSAGRVSGEIEYADVEIERGGEISGQFRKAGREQAAAPVGLVR